MVIQTTNTTTQPIILTDLSGYALLPNDPVDLGSIFNIYQVAQSDVLINSIATGSVIINNGTQDLEITAAIRYISLLIDPSQTTSSPAGSVVFQGVWDANTNTPTLVSGTGTKGCYYKISVAGSTTIDGINQWNVGDMVIFNGTTWDKITGSSSAIISVAGRTGDVVLTSLDVGLENVTNDAQIKRSEMAEPDGVATLDGDLNLAQNVSWARVINTPASYTPSLHAVTHGTGGSDVLPHQNLSGVGSYTHIQIDSALARLSNTSGTNTGDQNLSGLVPKTTTVNGHFLSSNVTITAFDIGLANVTNDAQIKRSEMAAADGVATLDSNSNLEQDVDWTHVLNSPASYTPLLHASTHEAEGTDSISHQNLSGAGTHTHADIDTALSRLVDTSGINTGDQNLTTYGYGISTGIISQGAISVNSTDNTLIDITAGTSLYVDNTNPQSPIIDVLSWEDQTLQPPNLDTTGRLWIGVERTAPGVGSFVFSTAFTHSQRRTIAILGRVWSNGTTTIEGVGQYSSPAFAELKTLEDLIDTFGSMNRSGNVFTPHSGSLLLDKSSGESFRYTAGAKTDFTSPNILADASQVAINAYHYHLAAGGNGFTTLLNTIDVNNYEVSGVLTPVPTGKFTIQRVFYFPRSGVIDVTYGQNLYNSLSQAVANVNTEVFMINSANQRSLFGAIMRAWLIVAQGASDLSAPEQAMVITTGGSGPFDNFSPVTLVDSVNGLIGTVDLTTANILDSSNARYVTDAQLTVIENTSGVNTGDQTAVSLGLGPSNTPEFTSSILSNLINGAIITSSDVSTALLQLDDSVYSHMESGFGQWTSGINSDTYEIIDGKFQVNRSGYGYILGKKITWNAGVQTGILAANATSWIYVDTDGNLYSSTFYVSHKIILFEVLYDGSHYFIKKENHPQSFPSQVSGYCHNAIGNIFFGSGAIIAKVGTGTGTSTNDRQIKIMGSDTLSDHGISTNIPDSAGSGVVWCCFYRNASGKWLRYVHQEELPIVYNSEGTITSLDSTNAFAIQVLYAAKDDINNGGLPQYISVIDESVYTSVDDALDAIKNGTIIYQSNELKSLELGQLGYVIVEYTSAGGHINQVQVAKSMLNQQFVGGGSGGAASNHALLSNLDYESSGHIGFAPATTGSGILKGDGNGAFASAVAGSDYLAPNGSGASLVGITAIQVGLGNVTNNAQLKRAAGDFSDFTNKALPVGADIFLIEDSANSASKAWTTISSIQHQTLSGVGTNTHTQIDTHIANTSNPHNTTAAQIGLGNVNNVAQIPMNYLSVDTTLGGTSSSDALVPSQNAIKSYIDSRLASKQDAGSYITGLSGDVVASGPNNSSATIQLGAVTLSKMADLAANSIIGNNTASSATPLALTGTQVKSLLAIQQSDVAGLTTLSSPTFAGLQIGNISGILKASSGDVSTAVAGTDYQIPGNYITILTGDITATGPGSVTATITPGSVTLSKMADLAANSIIGNNTGSSGTPIALTGTQVKSLLAIQQSDVAGLTTLSSPTFAGLQIGNISGILKASSGIVSMAVAGTDYLSGIAIQDEGINVTTNAKTLNFIGDVVVSGSGTNPSIQINGISLSGTLASEQVRRTSTFTIPTSWTDVTFDTTDVETNPSTLRHDTTYTQRVNIYLTATYLITYNLSTDSTGEADPFSIRLLKNGTTVIPGSLSSGIASVYVDFLNNQTFIANLNEGDYITLQIMTSAGNTLTVSAGALLSVIRLTGVQGPQGPQGTTSPTKAPTGASPASPSDGDLWYNTTDKITYAYDASRSKWLSVSREMYAFQYNSSNLGSSIYLAIGNNTNSGAGYLIPRNAVVTTIAASTTTSNSYRSFRILSGGTSVDTFQFPYSSTYVQTTTDANLTSGELLQIQSTSGSACSYPVVTLEIAWTNA